jgi:hypothetical protein
VNFLHSVIFPSEIASDKTFSSYRWRWQPK